MAREIDISEDEANAIEAMRKSGKSPAEFVAAATGKQEPAGGSAGGDDADKPVTRGELAQRDEFQRRQAAQASARQQMDAAADTVIAGAKELGKVSESKRAYLRNRAYEIAGKTEGIKQMTPQQLKELVAKSAGEAVKEEIAERDPESAGKNAGGKQALDKRIEAQENAADRSSDAGAGGSSGGAPTEAHTAAREILGDESDMQFGPGVEMDWPSEEAIKQKRSQAADAFLRRAYSDNRPS